jgi:PAS domain S-box-containing protein
MGLAPKTWLLKKLDAFLSESLRQGPPIELSRARMLVGFIGLLLFFALVSLVYMPFMPYGGLMAIAWVFCVAVFVWALWLLRRSDSTVLPAMVVCMALAVGNAIPAYILGDQLVATHAANMLVPIVSVYLLGWRLGLIPSVFMFLHMSVAYPLFSLYTVQGPWMHLVGSAFAALYILCAWAVGWLYSMARDEAQATLEQTARTLSKSESKLVSLIESTEDLVMALDTEGHLVTTNQATLKLFGELSGRQLQVGESVLEACPVEARELLTERFIEALDGHRVRTEVGLQLGGKQRTLDFTLNPILEAGQVVGVTVFGRDVTERREAESRLSEMHRNLLDVSRQAGMAEVATGVLHNVGNTLNSVNVSAGLVAERLRSLRVTGLAKASELLRENTPRLATFLTEDSRGAQLPAYLVSVSEHLLQEREALLAEVRSLSESLEHIKAVVSMQQAHARFAGMVELLSVTQLIDDALRLHAVSFERLGIQVRREYSDVPPVMVDRHKLLQILLNLLSNARHALVDMDWPDKRLILRVRQTSEGRVRIEVVDTGMGIPAENLSRIFTQGFTTKRDGHGFGLHISALAAGEMGGALTCSSEGRGFGATFSLELPLQGAESRHLEGLVRAEPPPREQLAR